MTKYRETWVECNAVGIIALKSKLITDKPGSKLKPKTAPKVKAIRDIEKAEFVRLPLSLGGLSI